MELENDKRTSVFRTWESALLDRIMALTVPSAIKILNPAQKHTDEQLEAKKLAFGRGINALWNDPYDPEQRPPGGSPPKPPKSS